MPKTLHFHRYQKMTWPNGKVYYKCMETGCPHYLPVADLVIGRESLCWGPACNHLVTITQEMVQKGIKHPMCEDCRSERREQQEELRKIV